VLYGNIITTRPCTRRTPGTHDQTRPGQTQTHDHAESATAIHQANTLHGTVRPGPHGHTTRHATRKRETYTKPSITTHRTTQHVKAETSGINQGKQGPVGVKKVVPV